MLPTFSTRRFLDFYAVTLHFFLTGRVLPMQSFLNYFCVFFIKCESCARLDQNMRDIPVLIIEHLIFIRITSRYALVDVGSEIARIVHVMNIITVRFLFATLP